MSFKKRAIYANERKLSEPFAMHNLAKMLTSPSVQDLSASRSHISSIFFFYVGLLSEKKNYCSDFIITTIHLFIVVSGSQYEFIISAFISNAVV